MSRIEGIERSDMPDTPTPPSAAAGLPESAAASQEAVARLRARLAVVAWMARTLEASRRGETA